MGSWMGVTPLFTSIIYHYFIMVSKKTTAIQADPLHKLLISLLQKTRISPAHFNWNLHKPRPFKELVTWEGDDADNMRDIDPLRMSLASLRWTGMRQFSSFFVVFHLFLFYLLFNKNIYLTLFYFNHLLYLWLIYVLSIYLLYNSLYK